MSAKGQKNIIFCPKQRSTSGKIPSEGWPSIVTIVAINLGFTVAGAVQIETVFSWPGLGGAIFEAVESRDYPLLQGAFLLIAISVIIANLLAYLTYSYLDPRVQTD